MNWMMTLAQSGIASLTWIEIALVIFITVFVGVVIWVMFAKRGTFNKAARIPLDDYDVMTPRSGQSHDVQPHQSMQKGDSRS